MLASPRRADRIGSVHRYTLASPLQLLLLLGLLAPACADATGRGDGPVPASCTGEIRCDGNIEIACADGREERRACDDGLSCKPGAGCAPCELGDPGCFSECQAACADGIATRCGDDGDAVTFACDPLQGMQCNPDGCTGVCAPASLGRDYIGCEYWPTVTANNVQGEHFAFAVTVTNTASETAEVVVHRGDSELMKRSVGAGETAVLALPWVDALKGPEVLPGGAISMLKESVLELDGAYRVRSTQPIVAYQFSPMEYVNHSASGDCPGGDPPSTCYAYTNDASLLLPTSALTGNYVVAGPRAWVLPGYHEQGDFVAITAARDGTEVWITPSVNVYGGPGVSPLPKGETRRVVLDAGDVIELLGAPDAEDQTLSGTTITTTDNAPLQVISGISAGFYPTYDTCCGDHLEETVLPIEALGDEYLVPAPVVAGAPRHHTVRLHGIFDDTAVTVEGLGQYALDAGEVVDLGTVTGDVLLRGDQSFAVTDYMHGEDHVGSGDPSLTTATPVAQYRDDYVFYTPGTYDKSYVAVIAKSGEVVTLDGEDIPMGAFEIVPDTEYAVARVELCDALGGKPCAGAEVHRATSAAPFGIVVYGVGAYTSYLYPGGLALEPITVPPIR